MVYELLITHEKITYMPCVVDTVEWQTERKGVPGILNFKIINDDILNFTEGDPVRFRADGNNIFYGFVFQKKRDKDGLISVTAYDQLRYLKNKDTYNYENMTAGEVVKMIAEDFNLRCGHLADTHYKIEVRSEDNQTLFDIIQNALDITLQSKKEMYVLYDDFGKLTLKSIADMKVGILLDADTAENFDYTSSIDGETYNKIKLAFNNEEAGKREIYIAKDTSHINQWGVLQYFETIDEKVNGKAKADALLKLYNQKTRKLSIKGAFGDCRVRAGSLIGISLNLGDIKINSYMLVEQATHTFEESNHTMDLSLRGGDFIV